MKDSEVMEQLEDLHDEIEGDAELSWAQKLFLPYWCWKSFIHDKHDAFRFKYDTRSLHIIEDEMMDGITRKLYINSIIYYICVFVCPFFFVKSCGEGLDKMSHYIYAIYAVITFIFEIYTALELE